MGILEDMMAADPELAREVAGLSPEQRRWLEEDLALRRRGADLARELDLDPEEVYQQLKQLRRPPIERLRQGLAHGRRRPRLPV